MDETPLTREELERRRQRVVDLITDGYANGLLDDDELESRVDLAERAESSAALEKLLLGLIPAGQDAALTVRGESALAGRAGGAGGEVHEGVSGGAMVLRGSSVSIVPSGDVPERRTVVAVLGAASRRRDWVVARRLRVFSLFGGVELDLRQAQLAAGESVIHCTTVMGGVHVIVPPGLPVTVDGVGILGAFDDERLGADPATEGPATVRICGLALMAGVEVEERLPGESAGEAKKRHKREARALADEQRRRLAAGEDD